MQTTWWIALTKGGRIWETGWVSAGRVPTPQVLVLWAPWGTDLSPSWVLSWLLAAQTTLRTPFIYQLDLSQGREGWTLHFLGSQCARDWLSKPLPCCQKGWCYSSGCVAIFCAPGVPLRIKINHNQDYLTSLDITPYLQRLLTLASFNHLHWNLLCWWLPQAEFLTEAAVQRDFFNKENIILFHPQ